LAQAILAQVLRRACRLPPSSLRAELNMAQFCESNVQKESTLHPAAILDLAPAALLAAAHGYAFRR